jgi:hypothetical protein
MRDKCPSMRMKGEVEFGTGIVAVPPDPLGSMIVAPFPP